MKKSKGMAISSFIFSLISFLPLINYITIPLSIYFGFKSLGSIKKHSNTYGGKLFAISGLIISILLLIFTISGLGICFAGYKEICKVIGMTLLS